MDYRQTNNISKKWIIEKQMTWKYSKRKQTVQIKSMNYRQTNDKSKQCLIGKQMTWEIC